MPAFNRMLPVGSRFCQCGGCGKMFTGNSSFEKHRITDINTGERRCLTTQEMYKIGMARVKRSQGRYWEYGATLEQLGKDGETRASILGGAQTTHNGTTRDERADPLS